MVNKRGRPAGGSDARLRLIVATQRHLDEGDLTTTSSRAIAAESGVSHTLVNYHFDGRDGLIAAAIAVRIAPHHVIAAASSGGRLDLDMLATLFVRLWEDPARRPSLETLARAATAGTPRAEAIVAYLQSSVFDQLSAALGLEGARRTAVVVVGVVFTRYVLRVPAMTSMDPTQLAALMRSMLPRSVA
ncbi:TetR family transcriptional regulator [Microbacterium sp. G2-8]|uniref:TetR/AcrR family transcriptional regulator n=1 Tax=Microbacterium sp. G2-8 TaxID=2842454 RepID=UPI001C899232|nr:TetR family transcriptional regulator [Microbacterium sp. G2-8]